MSIVLLKMFIPSIFFLGATIALFWIYCDLSKVPNQPWSLARLTFLGFPIFFGIVTVAFTVHEWPWVQIDADKSEKLRLMAIDDKEAEQASNLAKADGKIDRLEYFTILENHKRWLVSHDGSSSVR